MPDVGREKTLRLIPDRPGRGGSKTGLSTHVPVIDVRQATNVMLYNGRWRQVPDDVVVPGTTADPAVGVAGRAAHVFASYSLSNPSLAATRVFMGHHVAAGADYIWNYSTGLTVQYTKDVANIPLSDATGVAVPTKFLNVRNRCFMSWGVLNATFASNLIFDNVLGIAYDVGVSAPTAIMTYTIAPGFTGTATVTNGSTLVTYNTGSPAWAVLSPVVIGKTQIQLGGGIYTIGSTANQVFTAPGTLTATNGSAVATISAAWPIDGSYNGLQINVGINFAVVGSYTVSGSTTTVNLRVNWGGLTGAGQVYAMVGTQFQLTSAYNGTSAWSVVALIYVNPQIWTTKAAQYAYARYNPTTGHIGNIGPILSVTELNQTGVSTTLSNIVRDGSTSAIFKAGYTRLLIFRTFLSSGAVLYALGDPTAGGVGLITNDPAGATTFVDANTDAVLLLAFQAPLVSNRPPPVFAHMEYWNGQVFGAPVNDPSAIVYSADPSQVPFGVAEESYPSRNALRIPAQDGRVLGMVLVGGLLVITTERFAYYVAGNSSGNYRLLRFSTTMNGVTDYQMLEFSGEAGTDTDRILYVGADKKLYAFSLGATNTAISLPVQDQFDANVNLSTVRLQQIVSPGFRWVAVAVAGGTSPFVLVFDYENQSWLNIALSHKPQAFCSSYLSGSAPSFMYTQGGALYRWCDSTVTTRPATASSLQTPPLDFDTIDHLKQFASARGFVSNAPVGADPWTTVLIADETATSFAGNMTQQPDPVRSPQPGSANTVDSPMAVEVVLFSAQINTPIITGHRFSFKITWPFGTYAAPLDLYALDLSVIDMDAGQQQDLP